MKVSGYVYEYKDESPVVIAFHTWHYRPNLIVRLDYKGHYGLGEAAPLISLTGDTQEQLMEFLKKTPSLDLDPEKTDAAEFHGYLDSIGVVSPTLRAAFDFAFHEIKAKMAGIPVWKLYSRSVRNIPNSVTVYLKNSPEETAREVTRLLNKFPQMNVLKIKLKGVGDMERCRAIKNVVNRPLAYTLDANQGYTDPEAAVRELNTIVAMLGDVILIEQPTPMEDLDKLKHVSDNIRGSLIFADESMIDLDDARMIIRHKAAKGINIKLQKCGGIWPGRQIAELASSAGLKIMVGAMIEGPAGIAGSVCFANTIDNVVLTDNDTDLDMEPHFNGMLGFRDGRRVPPECPGFGISFNEEQIAGLARSGILKIYQI